MHEHGLMRGLLRQVERIALSEGAERVGVVRVWLGALSHMTPEHFQEHFDEIAVDTCAAGARIEAECSHDFDHPDADAILLSSIDVIGDA